jgi:DNA-binding NarL/FixJ family response regulator
MMIKKVVVCEDHKIVYEGLELLLKQQKQYQIVGYSVTGKDLDDILTRKSPDILILDLNLQDTDGFTLLREVKKRHTGVKIIILTMYHDSFLIEKARAEGANGYLLKNSSNEELLTALGSMDESEFFVTSAIQKEIDHKKMYSDRFAQKMKLTRRESEIVVSLARGGTSQEIADQLFISLHTVETHRKNIFRKLEVNNIADLVRFAHENHLV